MFNLNAKSKVRTNDKKIVVIFLELKNEKEFLAIINKKIQV